MKKVEDMLLIQKQFLQENIVKLELSGNLVSMMKQPGQFVQISTEDGGTLLRRPISIHQIHQESKSFEVIFRLDGKGTKILAEKKVGEYVNVMGPLGNGYFLDPSFKGKKACIIGGGIGTPPLYQLSKDLKNMGVEVTHILGFNSSKECILKDEFEALGPTFISTVDGSMGTRGFVTHVLQEQKVQADVYYACGPAPMLRGLKSAINEAPLYISMEERMACGMGACYACVCKTEKNDGDYKRICKEGPVFKAGEVLV